MHSSMEGHSDVTEREDLAIELTDDLQCQHKNNMICSPDDCQPNDLTGVSVDKQVGRYHLWCFESGHFSINVRPPSLLGFVIVLHSIMVSKLMLYLCNSFFLILCPYIHASLLHFELAFILFWQQPASTAQTHSLKPASHSISACRGLTSFLTTATTGALKASPYPSHDCV